MAEFERDPGGPARLGITAKLAVVFDLDGTLIDSRLDIAAAVNHALAEHDMPALSVPEITSYVGDGARALVSRAARLASDAPELEPLLASFLDFYAAHPSDHTLLIPGVREVLSELSHLPLALCTNKPRAITNLVLDHLRLLPAFSVVVAGGDLPKNKPDPLPLLHIAERLSLSPNQLVMVGDGRQDVACAKAVSALSVGVVFGMQGRESLRASQPDLLLESIAELPRALSSWRNAGTA